MSKYTTCFYDLDCEVNEDNFLTTSVDDRLEALRPLIFDFSYPIDDEITKARIEKAILKHYYMREIAFETWGLFKIKLNDRLNLIAKRYNDLYKAYDNEVNPYINSYVKEISKTTGESNSTNTDTSGMDETVENFNTQSDTPQGILQDLKEGRYSSYATIESNTRGVTNRGSVVNNADSESNVNREIEGLQGMTQAEAFRSYFDNVISLDEEIVNECSDLFLIIW